MKQNFLGYSKLKSLCYVIDKMLPNDGQYFTINENDSIKKNKLFKILAENIFPQIDNLQFETEIYIFNKFSEIKKITNLNEEQKDIYFNIVKKFSKYDTEDINVDEIDLGLIFAALFDKKLTLKNFDFLFKSAKAYVFTYLYSEVDFKESFDNWFLKDDNEKYYQFDLFTPLSLSQYKFDDIEKIFDCYVNSLGNFKKDNKNINENTLKVIECYCSKKMNLYYNKSFTIFGLKKLNILYLYGGSKLEDNAINIIKTMVGENLKKDSEFNQQVIKALTENGFSKKNIKEINNLFIVNSFIQKKKELLLNFELDYNQLIKPLECSSSESKQLVSSIIFAIKNFLKELDYETIETGVSSLKICIKNNDEVLYEKIEKWLDSICSEKNFNLFKQIEKTNISLNDIILKLVKSTYIHQDLNEKIEKKETKNIKIKV